MNRNDLRRVDMNLLVIFEALMFEKNLTRVAEKLFMGQPAVSAALGRLRDLFDDPLLLRNGRAHGADRARAGDSQGVATGDGRHLRRGQPGQGVRPGEQLRRVSHRPVGRRRVRSVSAACCASLQQEAPGIVVVVRRANYLLMPALLASGEISVGVSYTTDLPANAKRKKLRDIPCKVLRGDDRPGAADAGRILRAAACDGVVLRRPERQHRSGPGQARPHAAAWSLACRNSAACGRCSPAPK